MRAVLRGRLPVAAVAAVAIVAAVTVAYARRGGAAAADETYLPPANGVFTIAGHGFGHGHGMSQYGARNRALAGQSAPQILAFYYPGTTPFTIPTQQPLRVKLTASDVALTVPASTDLRVTDSVSGMLSGLTLDGQYRITSIGNAGGLILQHSTGGGVWTTVPLNGGAPSTTGTLTFSRLSGEVLHRVHDDGTARDYAGTLSAQPIPGGSAMTVVNTVGMNKYVTGVVPAEVFASWPAAALQSQAVAARTFAAFEQNDAPPSRGWDTCDTAACQVYGGVASYDAAGNRTDLQPASVVSAVAATGGEVLNFNGALAFTQFSASNGGWTGADGVHPYLTAAADPFDLTNNPYANWTATVTAADLAGCFLPAGYTLTALHITARDGHGDWHGRVTDASFDGRNGSATTTVQAIDGGDSLRSCAGLRSTFFTITSTVRLSTEPAGVRDAHGNVDVFAAGPGGDVLHRRYIVNRGWQPWQSLGGSLVGSPGALRLPDGTSRVYIRGTTGGLYEGKLDAAGAFHGWTSARATGLTSRPYPVRLPSGVVQVFYLSGTTLRYSQFTAADAPAGAANLGGTLAAGVAPAAVVTGSGTVIAFGTVASTHAVWTRSLAGGRWGGWTNIGGSTTGDLAAASPAAGVADLYVRGGSAGSLFARRFASGRWGVWTNTGGALSTGVFAAATGATTDVWTIGTNAVTYLRTRTASGLGGWSALP